MCFQWPYTRPVPSHSVEDPTPKCSSPPCSCAYIDGREGRRKHSQNIKRGSTPVTGAQALIPALKLHHAPYTPHTTCHTTTYPIPPHTTHPSRHHHSPPHSHLLSQLGSTSSFQNSTKSDTLSSFFRFFFSAASSFLSASSSEQHVPRHHMTSHNTQWQYRIRTSHHATYTTHHTCYTTHCK